MKILIACEESQTVCKAFRKRGFEAYSCDILEPSGGMPEWHIQDDVLNVINRGWDMMIAHPPCTYLTVASALNWQKNKSEQTKAFDFFMKLYNSKIKHIAIENPMGFINSNFRKPDQTIHPYMFGDEARKRTCLWLKNLPVLLHTNVVGQGELYQCVRKSGRNKGKIYTASKWYQDLASLPKKERSIARSKTFPGIANAMAEQWGNYLKEPNNGR